MLRIRRLGVAVAALAATAVVLAPATAAADDQSVYDAWHTAHPRFVKLRHDFDKAERHWENSGYKDPDPAYKAARRTVALAKKVTAALQRDVTSTAAGSKARSVALKGLNHRRKWADAERRAIVAFMRFDGDGYLRLHDDAKTYIHRAQKFEKQAGKLFKEAGVKLGA
jgi:hypothetical protein